MVRRMPTRPLDPALDSTVAPSASTPDAQARTITADVPQPAGLRPGVVVAETYEITRLLGQGGMGAVW